MRCGIYLRLSREDGGGESNSIQNQRIILRQYMQEHPEMLLAGEWVDDGWSGSRFDRPGFQDLMCAVNRGELDCILVKDLSRLGRDYIQTGRLLQEVFPERGIRFISVADHYDSRDTEFMEQSLMMPVLNLMNDAYCRDISQKVRWQQKIKRQQGEYIGAFAVYGYQKALEDKHCLVVDEETKEVIQCIYWLYLSGMSAERIAEGLDRRGILSPREYKRQQDSHFRCGFDSEERAHWSALAVRRILQNKMYTGVMVQGKDRKLSYKLDIRKKLPPEEWVCVEGRVPAIIPGWVFERVEGLRQQHLRCGRGKRFCDIWAGMGKDSDLKLWREIQGDRKWISFLFQMILGEETPVQDWQCRLFLVLHFRRIEYIPEGKQIIFYAIYKKQD